MQQPSASSLYPTVNGNIENGTGTETRKTSIATCSTLLRLNISGTSFILPTRSLVKFSSTLLGMMAGSSHEQAMRFADDYIVETKEFYFQRSPVVFKSSVLGYYRTGEFHIPPEVCLDEFAQDIQFWRLGSRHMAQCCREKCPDFLLQEVFMYPRLQQKQIAHQNKTYGKYKTWLWNVLNEPGSSWIAKIVTGITVCVIAITIIVTSLTSCSQFRYTDFDLSANESANVTQDLLQDWNERKKNYTILESLYICSMIYQIIETALRIYCTPSKKLYFKAFLPWNDFLCLTPFLIEICLWIARPSVSRSELQPGFTLAHFMQVFQGCKLARYSRTVRFLAKATLRCWKDIVVFAASMILLSFFFATLLYSIERENDDTPFQDIPTAIYFVFITISTVGYGDLAPKTAGGKSVAMLATFVGMIFMSFPISLIVSEFSVIYQAEEAKFRKKQETSAGARARMSSRTRNRTMSRQSQRSMKKLAPQSSTRMGVGGAFGRRIIMVSSSGSPQRCSSDENREWRDRLCENHYWRKVLLQSIEATALKNYTTMKHASSSFNTVSNIPQ